MMRYFLRLLLVSACLYGVLLLLPEPEPMEDIPFYGDTGFSVIAHRGGRGLIPGNTIEAARRIQSEIVSEINTGK